MSSELFIMLATPREPPEFWNQIARLHQHEIREGFLSTLTLEFLARLYAAVVRSDKGFLLAAVYSDTGNVAGFICGATDTGRVLRECTWRSGFRLVIPLLPHVFSRRTITRVLETLRYASGNGDSTNLPRAEILNFCVDGNQQGRGIGRRLFAGLTNEFKRRGIHRIKIVTGESQASAQKFYDSARASRVGDVQIHKGIKSVVFVYEST